MTYTPREIKDRVAVGDDIFIVEDLGNNRIRLIPTPTHVSEPGTPVNKALLQPIEDYLATGVVPVERTITAGTGLIGGGPLNADRTLSVDFEKVVPVERTITAGTGLIGGGPLNADRTLSVDFEKVMPVGTYYTPSDTTILSYTTSVSGTTEGVIARTFRLVNVYGGSRIKVTFDLFNSTTASAGNAYIYLNGHEVGSVSNGTSGTISASVVVGLVNGVNEIAIKVVKGDRSNTTVSNIHIRGSVSTPPTSNTHF